MTALHSRSGKIVPLMNDVNEQESKDPFEKSILPLPDQISIPPLSDIPTIHTQRLHQLELIKSMPPIPDEPDVFALKSYLTELTFPYLSIIRSKGDISMQILGLHTTIPMINQQSVFTNIHSLFHGAQPDTSNVSVSLPLLTLPQLNTLLFYICRMGDAVLLKHFLLSCKLDFNLQDDFKRTPLAYSCIGGHSVCVQLLCQQPSVFLDAPDLYGRTPLLHSLYFGHSKVVSILLQNGADMTVKDYSGKSALHYAVYSHDPYASKLILKSYMYQKRFQFWNWHSLKKKLQSLWDECDDEGLNPLMLASFLGEYKHIHNMLHYGSFNYNLQDRHGLSALHYCATNKHTFAIKELLTIHKGKLLGKRDGKSRSLLHIAAGEGNAPLLQYVLRKFPKFINDIDGHKRTPLHYAAALGKVSCLNCLCHFGADLNSIDTFGSTALHYSIHSQHLDCIHLLLKRGASTDIKNSEGRNAFLCAILQGNLEIIKIFAGANVGDNVGSNLNQSDKYGYGPLHLACIKGNTSIATYFLREPDLLESKDVSGATPLFKAVCMEWIHIIQLLLENGAKVNERDTHLRTPLHFAVSVGSLSIFHLLLEFGAFPIVPDSLGRLPIHEAAFVGHKEIFIELLEISRESLNVPDKQGKTPLHYACIKGHESICEILIENECVLNLTDFTPLYQSPLDYMESTGNKLGIELLKSNGAKTGLQIRTEAAIIIQRKWKSYWRVHNPKLNQIKVNAALRIQTWYRSIRQQVKYKNMRKSKKAKESVGMDKNVNEKIQRDRQVADRERKLAERERLEAIQLRKKMMDLKQKASLEYRQSLVMSSTVKNADKRGLLRHVAAIVIQSAWRNYKGYTYYKDVSKSPRKSKILKKPIPWTSDKNNAIVSRYKFNPNPPKKAINYKNLDEVDPLLALVQPTSPPMKSLDSELGSRTHRPSTGKLKKISNKPKDVKRNPKDAASTASASSKLYGLPPKSTNQKPRYEFSPPSIRSASNASAEIVRKSSHSLGMSDGSLGSDHATPSGYDDLAFHSMARPISRHERKSVQF